MAAFERRIPDGDDKERDVCSCCGFVAYQNPKVIVGSVVADEGQVLLCRRAIEPRSGFWTLPAGYLELGETTAEGARREALEEAGADIAIDGVLALFDVSRIGQFQIIYRARFASKGITPGIESLEARMFSWDEIPWSNLAFPTVRWALQAWHRAGPGELGPPVGNPPEDQRGTNRIDAVPAL